MEEKMICIKCKKFKMPPEDSCDCRFQWQLQKCYQLTNENLRLVDKVQKLEAAAAQLPRSREFHCEIADMVRCIDGIDEKSLIIWLDTKSEIDARARAKIITNELWGNDGNL